MNSPRPFINLIKKTLFKISASKAHEEYQQIKTLQLAQFFKFSLAIIIFSIVYFLVPIINDRNFSQLSWLCGVLVLCLLGWFFCDRLKKHLDIILLTLAIAFVANEYYGIRHLAFSTTPGTFALGFVFGHTSGTFEMILGLRFSNFYFKVVFYLILLVMRMILIHQVSIAVQIYHVYIIIIGLIVAYQKEIEDKALFKRFHDYRESLTKFKNLVSSGLSANLLILTRDLKQELFISDLLTEMARVEGVGPQEGPFVHQWLDQLIVEKQTLKDIDKYSSLGKQSENNFSVLSVLKEMGSRASFLRNQNKLAFNARIQDEVNKIFEIKVLSTIWDDKDALVLILNDVTDPYLNISLQVADRNKDKMLAMISHELRTPLNGILGVVNILKKDIKEPQQLRYLTVCHNSGELLLNLVNSILDLQQIREKKFALKFTKENLYELLGSIYDLFKFQFDQKGLTFQLEISSEVPKQIITDKNRLKQILINLIGNALKFTFKGGVTVLVDLDPVFQGSLHFRVSDTGIGIKEEDTKKIFKMYGRLDQQDTKTNTQGVGLGLEISNQLAILLGGGPETEGIKVQSQVQKKTTFSFSIRYGFKDSDADENRELNYYEPQVFSENIEDVGLKMTPYSDRDIFSNDRTSPVPINSGLRSNSENLIPKSYLPSVSLFSSQKIPELTKSPTVLTKKLYRSHHHIPHSRGLFSSSKYCNGKEGSFTTERKNKSFVHLQNPTEKPKILLVDDNPFNLLVAGQIVERLGFNVDTALNGELAIEQVRACASSAKGQCYSAILMDLQMPVMDGFEATKELRKMMVNKEIPEIPIIAVSANDTEDDQKRCKEVGMSKHLSKPLYEDLLRKALDKVLENEAVDIPFEEIDEAL